MLPIGWPIGSILACAVAMNTLQTGERLPNLEGHSTRDQHIRLPDEVAGHTAVLIFYRGYW